jgi:hypothetical protein
MTDLDAGCGEKAEEKAQFSRLNEHFSSAFSAQDAPNMPFSRTGVSCYDL